MAIAMCAIAAACTSGPSAPEDDSRGYLKDIEDARAEKDRVFAADPETIPAAKRPIFLPLKYYPVDPAFKVPAALKWSADRRVFDMPTSTGTERTMQPGRVLEVALQG